MVRRHKFNADSLSWQAGREIGPVLARAPGDEPLQTGYVPA